MKRAIIVLVDTVEVAFNLVHCICIEGNEAPHACAKGTPV